MNPYINEYKRYKALLDSALAQVTDENFFSQPVPTDNSVAIILNHLAGNFTSRFTEFLNSDGEKDWRNRDAEFTLEKSSRKSVEERWQKAWQVLEENVFCLTEKDLKREVKIRGVTFTVTEALARSLAHFSFHVGQIIYLAKHFAGKNWQYLTIAPGQSQQYNQNPNKEKAI